jgi:hypothetical protein
VATRLSESLRRRPDGGEIPALLGRADMENFLHRLAFQQANGQLSADRRRRTCLQVRMVLGRVRAMGLTRPGEVAAGLGEDFVITLHDIPRAVHREPGRDLPAEIVTQVCQHPSALEAMSSTQSRVAVELLIDTGRRPARSATCRSTAWPVTATANRSWSTTTTSPPVWAAGYRSPRPRHRSSSPSSNRSGPATRTRRSAS